MPVFFLFFKHWSRRPSQQTPQRYIAVLQRPSLYIFLFQIPTAIFNRGVVYKQSMAGFYSTSSDVVADTIVNSGLTVGGPCKIGKAENQSSSLFADFEGTSLDQCPIFAAVFFSYFFSWCSRAAWKFFDTNKVYLRWKILWYATKCYTVYFRPTVGMKNTEPFFSFFGCSTYYAKRRSTCHFIFTW